MQLKDALRVTGLTRAFAGKRAVDGVDLSVRRGEIMGFLGPNGAGKTTLMNMVMGLLTPDSGEIELLGVRGGAAHREVRLRVGYLQEKPRIYPEMSGRAYLLFFAKLYGVHAAASRVSSVLDRVGLTEVAGRPLGTYSRGMQQRACLARVLLHEPEFLLLDEPTLGLDPFGITQIRDILQELRTGGTTLLFSSHQLVEMERICDRVSFMMDGRIIAVGPPAKLVPERLTTALLRVELYEPVASFMSTIAKLEIVRQARETGTHHVEILVRTKTDARDMRAALARELASAGMTPLSVSTSAPTLEDVFLALAEPALEHNHH